MTTHVGGWNSSINRHITIVTNGLSNIFGLSKDPDYHDNYRLPPTRLNGVVLHFIKHSDNFACMKRFCRNVKILV
jgi:hypothetical protein